MRGKVTARFDPGDPEDNRGELLFFIHHTRLVGLKHWHTGSLSLSLETTYQEQFPSTVLCSTRMTATAVATDAPPFLTENRTVQYYLSRVHNAASFPSHPLTRSLTLRSSPPSCLFPFLLPFPLIPSPLSFPFTPSSFSQHDATRRRSGRLGLPSEQLFSSIFYTSLPSVHASVLQDHHLLDSQQQLYHRFS